jgi:flagellar basal body-associated protein FliL
VKSKLKFILPIPILLVVLGAAYMFFLAPKPAQAKPPKVDGTLFPLSGDFVVNLAGGHYGKLSVALLLSSAPPVTSGANGGATLPEDSAVRAVITDELTNLDPSQLTERTARHDVLARLLKQLRARTDEPITKVLITDLAVQ